MEPELQERLASVVGFLETSVQSAQQFAIEQAPEFVQQILRYKLIENSLETVFALIFAYTMIRVGRVLIKKGEKAKEKGSWGGDGDGSLFGGWLLCCLSFLPLLVAVMAFCTVIKILVAPKLYLLEYAATLLIK